MIGSVAKPPYPRGIDSSCMTQRREGRGADHPHLRASGASLSHSARRAERRVGARYVRRFPVSVRFGPGPTEGGGHPRAQAARPAGPSAWSRRGLAAAGEDIKLTRPGKSHPGVMLAGR
jgi:hypothetical protein